MIRPKKRKWARIWTDILLFVDQTGSRSCSLGSQPPVRKCRHQTCKYQQRLPRQRPSASVFWEFARTPRSSSRMCGYSGSQNPSKEMLTGVQFTGWTSYDCTADENKIELLSLLSKSFLIFTSTVTLRRALHCSGPGPTSYQRCYADRWPPAQPSPAQPSPAGFVFPLRLRRPTEQGTPCTFHRGLATDLNLYSVD